MNKPRVVLDSLECAQAAEAAIIISGDNHLLRLEQHRNTKIINPREFLEIIDNRNGG